MKLSIIMPVYNEEKTLGQIIEKVNKVDLGLETELIIIDDFSTDKTSSIIGKLKKKHKNIISFKHKKNLGKGAAIKLGLRKFTGDIVTIQDGDLEYDPEDFKKLIEPILNKKAKVVYGSRFLNINYRKLHLFGKHKTPLPSHYIANKALSFLTRILYNQKITDMETCYKMFTKDIAQNLKLKSNRFDIEPEITAKIIKQANKVIEIPINYDGRSFKEGKKITWKDGIVAIYTLLKYRFFD